MRVWAVLSYYFVFSESGCSGCWEPIVICVAMPLMGLFSGLIEIRTTVCVALTFQAGLEVVPCAGAASYF